jgi:hypothetical protein
MSRFNIHLTPIKFIYLLLLGFVPPTYSPKYNDVARVYLIQDNDTVEDTKHHQVAARAAKYAAPWDKIFALYVSDAFVIMPLQFLLLIGA